MAEANGLSLSPYIYYRLESDGTDSSGNGFTLSDTSVSYVAGKYGNCGSYNGSSSKGLNTSAKTISATNCSFACWVNLAALPGSGAVYHFITEGAAEANDSYRFRLGYYEESGSYYWSAVIVYQSFAGSVEVRYAQTLSTNTWYHVGFSQQSGSNNVKLYVAGSNVASGTLGGTIRTTDNRLAVGCAFAGASSYQRFTNGSIDDPIITNSVLTAQNFLDLASDRSIKTVNGLPIASVKTVNGLAIASVKTINGLA